MKKRTEPLTRYWFIGQLAARGMIAKIDQEGYITRPLEPHRPGLRSDWLRAAFRKGDCTHE